nr:DNA-directed DNA polymerase [Tanacetum cinerariifolium]
MRTRSSSNRIVESSTIPRRRNKRSQQQVVPTIVEILVATMADNRTMEEMLQAPTEGITLTLKFRNVPNDAIKLMLFPYSLEGAAKICSSSTDARIDKLTDSISNLVETFNKKMTILATVKAVEEKCVTCGSAHLYYDCIATDSNTSSACRATGTYNQGGPQNHASNQMGPPGFPPVQNNNQNQRNNVNRGNNFQGNKVFQAQTNHAPNFQAPNNQVQNSGGMGTRGDKGYSATKYRKHPTSSGASINLMPLSIWKNLSLPELTPTRMILELVDRSTTGPDGIAEDVFVKVGKFHFPTDFVVVDYVVNPRAPLILGRPFLRIGRSLINVYGEELTLWVDDEAITFKVGQTSKYSYNDAESINQIDVIDVACEEYVQEVLGFFDNSKSGNHTLIYDPIIALSSPSLTPFKGGYFILEEIEACLISKSIPPRIDDTKFYLEGDICLLEKLLNDDPSSSPLPLKELNVEEIKTVKSFIDKPPKLELKELPSHLEYTFLEGTDKLPVIIFKDLKDEEKPALLKVLKSNKRAIAWKISDIKGIDPHFCTNKILMEDDFKPAV